MVQTAPAEAYRKFDDLSKKHIDALRGLTKNIQDARLNRDNEAIKKSLKSYDDALERYIPPALMAQPSRDPRAHAPPPHHMQVHPGADGAAVT